MEPQQEPRRQTGRRQRKVVGPLLPGFEAFFGSASSADRLSSSPQSPTLPEAAPPPPSLIPFRPFQTLHDLATHYGFAHLLKLSSLRSDPAQLEFVSAFLETRHHFFLNSPTNSGKTYMIFFAVAQALSRGERVLFVTPTAPLAAKQIPRDANLVFTEDSIRHFTIADTELKEREECYKRMRSDKSGRGHLCTSTPENIRNDLDRGTLLPSDFSIIVLDEAHLIRGEYAMKRVAEAFRPTARLLAASASVPKEKIKKEELNAALGEPIFFEANFTLNVLWPDLHEVHLDARLENAVGRIERQAEQTLRSLLAALPDQRFAKAYTRACRRGKEHRFSVPVSGRFIKLHELTSHQLSRVGACFYLMILADKIPPSEAGSTMWQAILTLAKREMLPEPSKKRLSKAKLRRREANIRHYASVFLKTLPESDLRESLLSEIAAGPRDPKLRAPKHLWESHRELLEKRGAWMKAYSYSCELGVVCHAHLLASTVGRQAFLDFVNEKRGADQAQRPLYIRRILDDAFVSGSNFKNAVEIISEDVTTGGYTSARDHPKKSQLLHILRRDLRMIFGDGVIIYVDDGDETKRICDLVHAELTELGIRAVPAAGQAQMRREPRRTLPKDPAKRAALAAEPVLMENLEAFESGQAHVLVMTSVGRQGLDIKRASRLIVMSVDPDRISLQQLYGRIRSKAGSVDAVVTFNYSDRKRFLGGEASLQKMLREKANGEFWLTQWKKIAIE